MRPGTPACAAVSVRPVAVQAGTDPAGLSAMGPRRGGPGAILMRASESRFRRFGGHAGIVLLRAALVLALVVALADPLPG